MKDRAAIQSYINNFRRLLSPQLRKDIGFTVRAFPSESNGALLEFRFGNQLGNDDEILEPVPSLGQALQRVDQPFFGGNLDGFRFEGTNILFDNNRIILIKGGNELDDWNENAAQHDLGQLLNGAARSTTS